MAKKKKKKTTKKTGNREAADDGRRLLKSDGYLPRVRARGIRTTNIPLVFDVDEAGSVDIADVQQRSDSSGHGSAYVGELEINGPDDPETSRNGFPQQEGPSAFGFSSRIQGTACNACGFSAFTWQERCPRCGTRLRP